MPVLPAPIAEQCRADRLWGLAFFATLLMPWMLMVSRVGMEVCAALVVLCFLWRSYRARDWAWARTPFFRLCLLVWAYLLLVVTPLALLPSDSLPTAAAWIRFPVFFMALRHWLLRSRSALYGVGVSLLLMLCFVGVDTLWQFVSGTSLTGHARMESGRLTGPFKNPKAGLFVGKLLLPTMGIALMAWALHKRRVGMLDWGAVLAALLIAMVLTGERSPVLSTALGLGVAALLLMWKLPKLRLPCIAAGLAVVIGFVGLYRTEEWVQLRADQAVETMLNYQQSDYGLLAAAAYDIGRERLWHGTGFKGFRELCPDLHYNGYIFRGLHPHNIYAEWFAETGLPGLLLFIAMVALLLREAWQHYRRAVGDEAVAPAMLLGVLAQQCFPLMGMQSFFTNWPAMLWWFPLALAFSALPREKSA